MLYISQTRLKSQADEALLLDEQTKLRIKKIANDRKIKKIEIESEHETAKQIQEQAEALQKSSKDHALSLKRAELAVESDMTETNMKKYAIDSTKEIFRSLPLKNVELTNYINPNDSSGLGALLPGLQQLQALGGASGKK